MVDFSTDKARKAFVAAGKGADDDVVAALNPLIIVLGKMLALPKSGAKITKALDSADAKFADMGEQIEKLKALLAKTKSDGPAKKTAKETPAKKKKTVKAKTKTKTKSKSDAETVMMANGKIGTLVSLKGNVAKIKVGSKITTFKQADKRFEEAGSPAKREGCTYEEITDGDWSK